MIRLLFVNGDSMSRGAELATPERDAWPSIVARELGIDVVNLSCDGGSNRRVVRTTVEELSNVRAGRGLAYAEILVLCMWSAITRFERYDARSEDGPVQSDLGLRPDLPEELHWHRVADWAAREGDAASKAYYRHLCTPESASVGFFLEWVLLERFLVGLGAPCRFVFGFDTLPEPLPPEAARLAAMLDPTLRHGGLPPGATESSKGMVYDQVPFGSYGHPLVAGHQIFATFMLDWLRSDSRLVLPDQTSLKTSSDAGA